MEFNKDCDGFDLVLRSMIMEQYFQNLRLPGGDGNLKMSAAKVWQGRRGLDLSSIAKGIPDCGQGSVSNIALSLD